MERRGFLAFALIAGWGACAAPSSAPVHLAAGSKMLLAPTSIVAWESSNPAVAFVEWRTDGAGRRQAWLIARSSGSVVLRPARSGNPQIVGPTEVILNQSDFNNRQVGPPPPRPAVLKVTVD